MRPLLVLCIIEQRAKSREESRTERSRVAERKDDTGERGRRIQERERGKRIQEREEKRRNLTPGVEVDSRNSAMCSTLP